MNWTVPKLFVDKDIKIWLTILVYDLWKIKSLQRHIGISCQEFWQRWQYFLVPFHNLASLLTLYSCLCSWVMVLSVKKFGSKYCLYGSTKAAGIHRGAGKPGHVTSAAVVNACGWLGSMWESTARGGPGVKRSTASFPLNQNKSNQYCIKYILCIFVCVVCVYICVCVHIYTHIHARRCWVTLKKIDSMAGNSGTDRCWPHAPRRSRLPWPACGSWTICDLQRVQVPGCHCHGGWMGTGGNAEASFAGRPKFFDAEENNKLALSLMGIMVIFLFLAHGTYDTSPSQIKSQGGWQIGYSWARQPYV